MHRQLKCPMCGEELDRLQCPGDNCTFNEDFSITPVDRTIDEVIQQLISDGAYINVNTETLIIPGKTVDSRFLLSGEKAAMLASFLRTTYGMTQRTMQAHTAMSLLNRVRHEDTSIPKAYTMGSYPLMYRDNGKLRYSGCTFRNGYYYKGDRLSPQYHGGVFDEWVDTFRWATPEDRDILRAWLLSLFAQPEVPAGRFPALLLATYSGSSVGKTETANMISAIFGRMISRSWTAQTAEKIDRELLSGEHRFFCADNLVPTKRNGVIEDGQLSEYLTKGVVESKRLYSTGGTARINKPTIDILTANYPMLALDLLQRVVVVGLCNKPIKGNGDWIGQWKERRNEILEEGMHLIQENSDNAKVLDDCTCGYPEFRYPLWYSVAVECNGGVFNPYPISGCVSSPLDEIMRNNSVESMRAEDLIPIINGDFSVRASSFRKQSGELTEDKLCSIVKRWSRCYSVEVEKGERWIITK